MKNFHPRQLIQVQTNLFGESEFVPVFRKRFFSASPTAMSWEFTDTASWSNYLNKHLLPSNVQVEGVEEIPCVLPYEQGLPKDISAYDEPTPKNCSELGLHGFCYDYILQQKWNNWGRLINKAKLFHCTFGPHFSVLMDGYRCEAVEAIRRNRVATLNLQANGIPTIQTVSRQAHNSLT